MFSQTDASRATISHDQYFKAHTALPTGDYAKLLLAKVSASVGLGERCDVDYMDRHVQTEMMGVTCCGESSYVGG